MNEDKTVFVDEETYTRMIQELGYKPSNLVKNKFIPKNQALVVDDKTLSEPFFIGFKPNFYYRK